MIDTKFLDDLAKKISEVIPSGIKDFQSDMEKNIKAVLRSTFAKLDLVTREEFDAQVKVLARTRAKLTDLEKKLAEMEDALSKDDKVK